MPKTRVARLEKNPEDRMGIEILHGLAQVVMSPREIDSLCHFESGRWMLPWLLVSDRGHFSALDINIQHLIVSVIVQTNGHAAARWATARRCIRAITAKRLPATRQPVPDLWVPQSYFEISTPIRISEGRKFGQALNRLGTLSVAESWWPTSLNIRSELARLDRRAIWHG